MKLTIERAALLKALAHVQSVVERRNTIPILSNVLITAQKGRLSLAATDMDLAITETVEASAAKTGSTTAPAHTLYEIVRKLPDGAQVELETARRRQQPGDPGRPLALHPAMPAAGRLPGDGRGRPAAPLPAPGDRPQGHHRPHPLRHLQRGDALLPERHLFPCRHAERHRRCCAASRPTAIAWPGSRCRCPRAPTEIPGVIVPRKTVGEVRKLLDESDGSVEIELSDTRIRFATGNVTLVSKLIDGTFPDYERVIPTGNDKVLNVPCKEFADAVDRVSTISTEKSRAVKLAVAKGVVTLSATSPDAGSATEEIEVEYKAAAARDRLQLALPARHHRADRGRRGALPDGRRRLADPGARRRRRERALRAHADAGMTAPPISALAYLSRRRNRRSAGRPGRAPASPDRFPQLPPAPPRLRPRARRAGRRQRRGQDQPPGGALLPGAGPRPAPGAPGRGLPPLARRRAGRRGLGGRRHARHAGRAARHRHRPGARPERRRPAAPGGADRRPAGRRARRRSACMSRPSG